MPETELARVPVQNMGEQGLTTRDQIVYPHFFNGPSPPFLQCEIQMQENGVRVGGCHAIVKHDTDKWGRQLPCLRANPSCTGFALDGENSVLGMTSVIGNSFWYLIQQTCKTSNFARRTGHE